MKFFEEMSYKLDRTFAITLGVAGVFLCYIAMIANRSNVLFFAFGILMFVLMVYFIVLGYRAYNHPTVTIRENAEVFTKVCPKCGEMVKDEDTHCPYCSQELK